MNQIQLSSEIKLSQNTLPLWVQLLPIGPEISTADGREFTLSEPELVIQNSMRENVEMSVDYEHSIRDENQHIKPAAGWVKALELRDDGIWGKVEWTKPATQLIENKEYRYLSPLLSLSSDTAGNKVITKIVNVGLTNTPALEMAAFCSTKTEKLKVDTSTFAHEIASLMSLDTSNPNEILAALRQKNEASELASCSLDVEEAIGKYVFPRSCEPEFLSMRKVLGKQYFESIVSKLSLNGFGFVHLNSHQTKSLPKLQHTNNLGLSDGELEACKLVGVEPELYKKIKEQK